MHLFRNHSTSQSIILYCIIIIYVIYYKIATVIYSTAVLCYERLKMELGDAWKVIDFGRVGKYLEVNPNYGDLYSKYHNNLKMENIFIWCWHQFWWSLKWTLHHMCIAWEMDMYTYIQYMYLPFISKKSLNSIQCAPPDLTVDLCHAQLRLSTLRLAKPPPQQFYHAPVTMSHICWKNDKGKEGVELCLMTQRPKGRRRWGEG